MGKRKAKKRSAEEASSDGVSCPAAQKTTDAVKESDASVPCQSLLTSSPRTPRRSQRHTRIKEQICLTSTPVHTASAGNLTKQIPLISELEEESHPSRPKTRSGGRRVQTREAVKGKRPQKKAQSRSESSDPPARRPRLTLAEELDSSEKDSTLLSSDLSLELSQQEEQLLPSLSLQEEGESDEDEEEELPSFLMLVEKKPPGFTEGDFVWHKFKNYPFWPAVVKNVYHKRKKASIMFIDYSIVDKKKGFVVPLKSLKPFHTEESKDLMHKAKEQNDVAVSWSLDLISDYCIRLACRSFSGSFVEYVAHDMSFPVRKKYPQESLEKLSIPSDRILMEEACEDPRDGSDEQQEVSKVSKRLLPDRSRAAYNRANEKLVHYIVNQRMVEKHLLAVIQRQQPSTWLNNFLANRPPVKKVYLEDEQQLDRVYWYLDELYARASTTRPGLVQEKSPENVPFVMDVLLPEAIIKAIAELDKVSLEKAEEKYLELRPLSRREKEEMLAMIDRHIEKKSRLQKTKLTLSSD